MDEAGGVGGGDAPARRDVHVEDLLPVSPPPLGERRPVEKFHRQEHLVLEHPHLVYGYDVGMADLRDGLPLANQARGGLGRVDAMPGMHQLDGHLAVELGVVGGIDDAHPAASALFQDGEPADDGAAIQRGEDHRVT